MRYYDYICFGVTNLGWRKMREDKTKHLKNKAIN